jgi:hypothetical protein
VIDPGATVPGEFEPRYPDVDLGAWVQNDRCNE